MMGLSTGLLIDDRASPDWAASFSAASSVSSTPLTFASLIAACNGVGAGICAMFQASMRAFLAASARESLSKA
jgi:hypothetical protein